MSSGIKTRLKQCHLVVLMNTKGMVCSIPRISIVNWRSAYFGITWFCLLRLSLGESSPCYLRKAPICVSLRLSELCPCYTRKTPLFVCIVAFRVDLGVSSEDLAQTDGDICVLYEEFSLVTVGL